MNWPRCSRASRRKMSATGWRMPSHSGGGTDAFKARRMGGSCGAGDRSDCQRDLQSAGGEISKHSSGDGETDPRSGYVVPKSCQSHERYDARDGVDGCRPHSWGESTLRSTLLLMPSHQWGGLSAMSCWPSGQEFLTTRSPLSRENSLTRNPTAAIPIGPTTAPVRASRMALSATLGSFMLPLPVTAVSTMVWKK